MPESLTVQIIIGVFALLVAVFGSGGLIYLVVNSYLNKRQNTAAAVLAEHQNEEAEISLSAKKPDVMQVFENKLSKMVAEKMTTLDELQQERLAKNNLKLLLDIERSKNADFQVTMNAVLVEQGAAQERERNCQQALKDIHREFALFRQKGQPEL